MFGCHNKREREEAQRADRYEQWRHDALVAVGRDPYMESVLDWERWRAAYELQRRREQDSA